MSEDITKKPQKDKSQDELAWEALDADAEKAYLYLIAAIKQCHSPELAKAAKTQVLEEVERVLTPNIKAKELKYLIEWMNLTTIALMNPNKTIASEMRNFADRVSTNDRIANIALVIGAVAVIGAIILGSIVTLGVFGVLALGIATSTALVGSVLGSLATGIFSLKISNRASHGYAKIQKSANSFSDILTKVSNTIPSVKPHESEADIFSHLHTKPSVMEISPRAKSTKSDFFEKIVSTITRKKTVKPTEPSTTPGAESNKDNKKTPGH